MIGQRPYSFEYLDTLQSRRWRIIRRVTFALSWGRDCVFPLLPAQDCDHLSYRNLSHELPLRDVVGLSRFTHRRIVTPLRARYGRRIVNPPLQLAFGAWCAFDVCVAVWLFEFVKRFV